MELPESVINGRFRITERPMAAPGKCACCGAVDKPVVDFGFDVDYYGAVLMCVECILCAADVAKQYFGAADADEAGKTQGVPLPFIDQEAINEYVARALVSVASLNAILAINAPASPQVHEEADADNDGSDGDSAGGNEPDTEPGDPILVGKGSTSVPASSSSKSAGILDL